MKSFLQNLLVCFALGLCALVAVQWVRERQVVRERQLFADRVHATEEQLRALTAAHRTMEAEAARLGELRKESMESTAGLREENKRLELAMAKATNEVDRVTQQLERYKEALEKANASIQRQNEETARQNQAFKRLMSERNEAASKWHDLVKDYNELVEKWNKLQEELGKPDASKAPVKK